MFKHAHALATSVIYTANGGDKTYYQAHLVDKDCAGIFSWQSCWSTLPPFYPFVWHLGRQKRSRHGHVKDATAYREVRAWKRSLNIYRDDRYDISFYNYIYYIWQADVYIYTYVQKD